MSAGRIRVAGVACAAVSATALLLGAAAPALADHPLEPDLVTLPLKEVDLSIDRQGPHIRILLENEVGNRGAGPMEIFAASAPTGCTASPPQEDPYYAMQRVFVDSNDNETFERNVDTESTSSQIGCLKYHDKPGHDHWHVLGVSGYTLISEKDGSEIDARKAGYCLLDVSNPFAALDPGPRHYFGNGCSVGQPDVPPFVEGISPGWADVYGQSTPGQFVNVTNADPGRYCLRSEADPLERITEASETNNLTDSRVRINPDELKIKRLPGACQIPPR